MSFFRMLRKIVEGGSVKGMPRGPGQDEVAAFTQLTTVLVGGGVLSWGLYNSLFTVEGGQRAVMFSRITGVKDKIYGSGTHFCVPWLERPEVFDVRTRPIDFKAFTGTRDLQKVDITLRLLFRPNPDALPVIWSRLGKDYDQRVLESIAKETLKSVIAQFNGNQLIKQREEVSMLIKRNLVDRAKDFHIIVEDTSITHLTFGREYTAAVEAKQVAQQDSEKAKYLVLQAMQDKKSTIIKAEGEAASAQLIGEAMAGNPGYLQLRRLDAALAISDTVSKSHNRVWLQSDSLLLNINEVGDDSEFKRA